MFCHQTDSSPLSFTPSELVRIERNWQQFIAWRPTKEIATLCRLVGAEGHEIQVAHDVSYKEVVGLRFNELSLSAPFLVVSALALVKTAAGELLLLERDSGDWPHSLELPGGFLRANAGPEIDCHSFIRNRIKRDLMLYEEDIATTQFLTPFSNPAILEYMLVYECTLHEAAYERIANNHLIQVVPKTYTASAHPEHLLPLHAPTYDVLTYVANYVGGKTTPSLALS